MIEKISFFIGVIALLYLLNACNKISDLDLDPDPIDVHFQEVPFVAKTITGDTSLTYDDSLFIPEYFAGAVNDPFFGTAEASLNFQIGINSEPNLAGAMLDSVVLSMAFDSIPGRYGPEDANLSFEVYEITEDLSKNVNYYSSHRVTTTGQVLGSVDNVVPVFDDTIYILEPVRDILDTVPYDAHLRIPLDQIGTKLLALEQGDFASLDRFVAKFKGLRLQPSASCEGMLYFGMTRSLTRLNLYYTQNDTAKLLQLPLIFGESVVFNTYKHEVEGSVAEAARLDPSPNDSLLYCQSMEGTEVLIEVGDLSTLDQRTINFAELVLTMAVPIEDDTSAFSRIQRFRLQEVNDNNNRQDIVDIMNYGGTDVPLFFGGVAEIDEDTKTPIYHFNITEQLRLMVAGEASKKMVLSSFFRGSEPNRIIFFGSSNSPFAAKIKVTHTSTF